MDRNKKIIAGVGVGIAIIAGIFIFKGVSEDNIAEATDTPITSEEIQVSETVEPTEIPTEEPTIEPTVEPTEEPSEEPTEEPEETEEEEIVYNVTDEDVYNNMDEALNVLIEYSNKSTITNRLITNNGYFYSINVDKNVEPEVVYKDGGLEGFDLSKVKFPYVKPDDVLANSTEMKISAGSEPELFFAYEFDDYYIMGNEGNFGGKITKDGFNNLMSIYSNDSDDIVKYTRDSNEFLDMEFLAAHNMESLEQGIATRYAYGDGKYAVLITSPADRTDEIHGYMYKMGDEGYDLLESNFQDIEAYEKALSLKYPDFNNEIMPDYDLDSYENYLEGNVSYIASSIQEDSNLIYGCGSDGLYYFEFESGNAYVLVRTGTENNQEQFEAYQVKTQDEAEQVLEENVRVHPPYIILKQY